MSLTKLKDISVVVGALGILTTIILVTFTYIASIKTNTDGIDEISTAITRVEKRTDKIDEIERIVTNLRVEKQLILSMMEDINYLKIKAETKEELIYSEKGGKLTALDRYTIINIKPNALSEDIWFKYNPIPTGELPSELPLLIKPVGYNFALTPYSSTGVKLPDLFFKEPVEVSIAYTNLNLDLTTNRLTDLTLQRWDDKQKKWMPVKTTVNGEILHAETTQPGYFVLGFSGSEKP